MANLADKGASPYSSLASCALKLIDEIFGTDAFFDDLDPEARKALRLTYLAPKLEVFKIWCDDQTDKVMEGSGLKRAFNYAIKQWPGVERVLLDGRLELSNNRAERAIKPVVMARKGFLFCCTPNGAEVMAGMFSIIQSAILNALKPYQYLTWLFEMMPNTAHIKSHDVLDSFMPWSSTVPDVCKKDGKACCSHIPEIALRGNGIMA